MPAFFEARFEQGLDGWQERGPARFLADASERHGGERSAGIEVSEGAELNYQQLLKNFDRDVAAGDVFEATVWVRSRDVSEDPGAYFVLEFLRGDHRLAISHSETSSDNGRDRWERLSVQAAAAQEGTDRLRVALVLHAHGTAWFDDLRVVRTDRAFGVFTGSRREVTVNTADVVHPRFGGVDFHVFYHIHPAAQQDLDQVMVKRWRELRPSFARVTHTWDWDDDKTEYVAGQMRVWQETGTEVYLTTWDPDDTNSARERAAYAKRVADMIEYFVRDKGLTNLKTYCMTNELSLGGWGRLRQDLPKFRDYHRCLHEEFKSRELPVQLLATDAAPAKSWHTIEWATEHMDDITGVYGGHHYINGYALEDVMFYRWFSARLTWGARLARSKGKDFILGEFGCKQDGSTVNGKKNDACIYWDTPREPLVAIQLAEAVIAALNAGVYALGNWTFADFPDDYRPTYQNKWGTFKWSGSDRSTRPHYYAYALLTRYFRGPAVVFRTAVNDGRIRAAALGRPERREYSLAVVNRNDELVSVSFSLQGVPDSVRLRRYVYDPASPPDHPYGDLPPPAGTIAVESGQFTDALCAGTLTVYTSVVDDAAPPPVTGLSALPRDGGTMHLRWPASPAADLCYYRVFRSTGPVFDASAAVQIGSTVATHFSDTAFSDDRSTHYRVVAVDQSGNAGVLE